MTVKISSTFYDKLDSTKVEQAMNSATKEVIIDLYNKCVSTSPYRTGKLQESHSYETNSGSYRIEALLKNGARYWSYVEFGTSRIKTPRRWVYNAMVSVDPPRKFFSSFKSHYQVIK